MSEDLKILTFAWIRYILTDRSQRRRWMTGILLAIILLFVVGNWPLSSWLSENPWLLIAWWGGCAWLCFFLILFAFYDALRVIREEREKVDAAKKKK